MAHLIPPDVVDLPTPEGAVARFLADLSGENCWIWKNPEGSSRPSFIVIGSEQGVLAIDVLSVRREQIVTVASSGLTLTHGHVDPIAATGRRLETLRAQLPPATPVRALIALPCMTTAEYLDRKLDEYLPPDVAICSDDLERSPGKRFDRASINEDQLAEIRAILFPESQFTARRQLADPGRASRASARVLLDLQQESIARTLSTGVTLVTGVAGSGKTLVLCARARILKEQHPDWNIQVLCYNRSLVPYLKSLIGDSSVNVATFHSWAFQRRITIPFADDDDGTERARVAIQRAIAQRLFTGQHDAILIDEAQDLNRPGESGGSKP